MKSPDGAPVIAGIGLLSVAAVTLAFFRLMPGTEDVFALTNEVSYSDNSTVIPLESPAQTYLASIQKTIDADQLLISERAKGLDVDSACFELHMRNIDSLQAEIARAEASMATRADSDKAQILAYIQMNLDRIQNEFEAINGLFPAPPHGAPRHYCT